jgi:hypothetical protein
MNYKLNIWHARAGELTTYVFWSRMGTWWNWALVKGESGEEINEKKNSSLFSKNIIG